MNVLPVLRWSFSLGVKFFSVVPWATLLVVLGTLVSQIAVLLATLLPLKVIMLLGSSGIPRYFPAFFQDFDRSALVLGLSVAAVVFYALHLAAEKLIDLAALRGARTLIVRSRKLTLFVNQERVATRAYQRYSRSLAGSIFTGLALVALLLIYPALALCAVLYVCVAWLVVTALYRWNGSFRHKLETGLDRIIDPLAMIGFLVSFAYMVVDHLLGASSSVLLAVISLLLIRQVFKRIAGLISDLASLYGKRLQLNALFFSGHVLNARVAKESAHGPWGMLEASRRLDWLSVVLSDVVGLEDISLNSWWCQTGVADVVAFRVEARHGAEPAGSYLVKLFNTSRSAIARHEAMLFLEQGSMGLPAPVFLGAGQVSGLHCHVFEWPAGRLASGSETKKAVLRLVTGLLAVQPAQSLVTRYSRSKPFLWQRLDERMIERLKLVVDDETSKMLLARFAAALGYICQRLKRLPLVIVNPDAKADNLWILESGKVLAGHWGRWHLEPAGAGWPVQEKMQRTLVKVLHKASIRREDLQGVTTDDLILSALSAAFEKAFQRQNYRDALELLPRILAIGEAGPASGAF